MFHKVNQAAWAADSLGEHVLCLQSVLAVCGGLSPHPPAPPNDPARPTTRPTMIQLTQLGGDAFVLNAELIRYVESRPDTIITLTNNERLVVREPMSEVLARAVEYQRSKHLWKGLESRIENQASRIENRESSIENREPRTQSLV